MHAHEGCEAAVPHTAVRAGTPFRHADESVDELWPRRLALEECCVPETWVSCLAQVPGPASEQPATAPGAGPALQDLMGKQQAHCCCLCLQGHFCLTT